MKKNTRHGTQMWSILLKNYREREEKRIKKQQGWTGKESRKKRIEKEGGKNGKWGQKKKTKVNLLV